MPTLTAAHWGIYELVMRAGAPVGLRPFAGDGSPSAIGDGMFAAYRSSARIARPAVRRSVLAHGPGAGRELRGIDPFVEVSWDRALDLVAAALKRTIAEHGNEAIFGGSYGWSSAGRFHHAQSQIHRFLNSIGGYVRHVDSYSLGAAHVLMQHIVAPMRELTAQHTSWNRLADTTRLFVSFGGVPAKNAQVSPGGAGRHQVPSALARMREAGVRFVNISPVGDDIDTGGPFEWLAIRPNTDTAFMLGLAHTLYREGRHDTAFLETHCVGFDRFARYLTGQSDGVAKDAAWAAEICGIPAETIVALARDMASTRTMVTGSWSLQRSHHGEQPYWMILTLAAMLGQIGLPGGGFGVGYGALNMVGSGEARFSGPTLPQGNNPVEAFIPVARLTDMLERPGTTFRYGGRTHRYPDIDLVYWAGGNPFHHHQDLNRLRRAWRKPAVIVVHEQFWTPTAKQADIVLPATSTLERDDIAQSQRERYLVAMKRAFAPVGQARDDYAIFTELAARLGAAERFTENRDVDQWLRHLYESSRPAAERLGIALPSFDRFWAEGLVELDAGSGEVVLLQQFRDDPAAHPLQTPSGRIELFSERIAGFDLPDCGGHAQWYEPAEWLGSPKAETFAFHLISDQPSTKLHSQLDHGALSQSNKIGGREPITLNAGDARRLGIADGDLVRVWNERGACLAGARLSDRIRTGVVRLSTGAWYDPVSWADAGSIDKHGNANVLTLDIPTSELAQGCAAQTCLVDIERYDGPVPPITAHDPPPFATEPKR